MTPYNYVLNDPLKYIDPFGMDTVLMNVTKMESKQEWEDVYSFKLTFSLIKDGVETGIDIETEDGTVSELYFVGHSRHYEFSGNRWYDVGEEGTSSDSEIRFESYTSGSGREYKNSIRLKYVGKGGKRILAHYGKDSSWGSGCQVAACNLGYSTYGEIDAKGSQQALNGIRKAFDKYIPSTQTTDSFGRKVQSPNEGYNFILRTHSTAPKAKYSIYTKARKLAKENLKQ